MKIFSLKEVCRSLVKDLQSSVAQKNRIKLGIDIQLPETLGGETDDVVSTITWLSRWLESRLINGAINIDVVKRSQINDDIILNVIISGRGTKEINKPEFISEATQFALMQTMDVRVKPEDDRLLFEFNAEFRTFEGIVTNTPTFVNKSVLIAEDSEINALVFSGFMEEWGCEITIVENGREAFLQAKAKSFDLILMDIHMPVMDGNEAILNIRAVNRDVPIIALTASTLEADIKASLDNGANDYLLKPVASKTLYSMLHRYLVQSKNADQSQPAFPQD